MRKVSLRHNLGRLLIGLVALVLITIPFAATHGTALAHPLGNFTVNRYARIELYRDAVDIHYVLDLAEIPTFQALPDIDTNGDSKYSQAELDAYADKLGKTLPQSFSLTLNGGRPTLQLLERHIDLLDGQGGLNTTRIAYVYRAMVSADSKGTVSVGFEDRNYADRAGWREIVVRPSEGSQAQVDAKLLVDVSDALRSYPAETLRSAPDVSQVTFTWVSGTGASAPESAIIQVAAKTRSNSGFAKLLDRDISAAVFPLLLLAAFGFGMLHALGPGHGKSVVGAYLVGSKGTPRHAIALGLTVTATHTSTVYLLGFVTLYLGNYLAPDELYLYLGVAAGASIVLMGLSLLVGRLTRLRGRGSDDGAHKHGIFGKAHSHLPTVAQIEDEYPHEHEHEHEEHAHDHGRPKEADDSRVTWRSLLSLGVIGGMLPCPSAIIVMLAAIASGRVLFGMLLIVAFSAGLAAVLTAIGLALVFGKRLGERSRLRGTLQRPVFARLVSALPVLSAAGITLAGLAITYQAFQQNGL